MQLTRSETKGNKDKQLDTEQLAIQLVINTSFLCLQSYCEIEKENDSE